jgi:hypothetical protein
MAPAPDLRILLTTRYLPSRRPARSSATSVSSTSKAMAAALATLAATRDVVLTAAAPPG